MFESKVATVTGFIYEKDPASRNDTFGDHVDRVLWSVDVPGLPCTWIPEEYGGSTFAREAAQMKEQGRVVSTSRAGGYAHMVGVASR